MTPFTDKELDQLDTINTAFNTFKQVLAGLPHEEFDYPANTITGKADTRFTAHLKTLENELDRVYFLFNDWIRDPKKAGEAKKAAEAQVNG